MFNRLRNSFAEFFKRRRVAKARRLWLQALRSGQYAQTTGQLHDETGYCCLGVACDVYQQYVGGLKVDEDLACRTYDGWLAVLPGRVAKWLDINVEGAFLRPDGSSTSCTVLNDGDRLTFDQIADEIENPANTFKPFTESEGGLAQHIT